MALRMPSPSETPMSATTVLDNNCFTTFLSVVPAPCSRLPAEPPAHPPYLLVFVSPVRFLFLPPLHGATVCSLIYCPPVTLPDIEKMGMYSASRTTRTIPPTRTIISGSRMLIIVMTVLSTFFS